ncbi:MAG: low-specificity L-threonine aldolase [Eubacteriales bacterium]
MIDLRSDTVTMPTASMREAMFVAQVGDDVYGDDPTMSQLETLAAQMLGKEAAMFVPSGTMGNQVAIMTHVPRGGEVICGSESHIIAHEVGGAAAMTGAFMRPLAFPDNMPNVAQIANAIRGENIHYPDTALIEMENPLAVGKVVPLETLQEVYKLAQSKGIPIHLDGARLFNGALALGVEPKELTACCDSVMVCLSKGLCAPVGSILAGSADFIHRARRNRKMMGGGLRQAGFLAAAGILALTDMTKRLHIDHENAKILAEKLQKIPQVIVDLEAVEINMVFFKLDIPQDVKDGLEAKMLEKSIKINGEEDGYFRFVTTNDVTTADLDTVIAALMDCIA